ncbi:MAG: alpha/beta fold hydrolase [Trueperaceae bacterium]|nr:MAG: alpha/beta fold hydrolase [Trueperaceae bacterium]
MADRRDLGAARAPRTLRVFREHEADWMLMRTLGYMNVNAAEVGECFDAARRIDERDPDSWPHEWARIAERTEGFARHALEVGDTVSARGAFQRSSNYYRAAEYGCVPSHPRFRELWQRGVAAFREAARLYEPPIHTVEVMFEGAALPGYFWRPADDATARPTLFVAGGNDDTIEEDVFIIGHAAVQRGYNVFTFSYPGHRNAVHTDPAQVRRPDQEVPFGAALDVLSTLPGVDDRIALAGFSGGGYVAPRVAIHDDRVSALIANNPMIDLARVGEALLGPLIRRVPGFLLRWALDRRLARKPLIRAYMEYGLWVAGYAGTSLYEWMTSSEAQADWARFTITDTMHDISCPTLSLVGAGEGEEMLRQTREFHEAIRSREKSMHVFTLDRDGTHDHCMLDNHARMQQVLFEWLNGVFGHTPESGAADAGHERRRAAPQRPDTHAGAGG